MKQRLIASALFALLALIAAIPAHAQSTAPVVLPNGCGTGNATNSLSYLTVDSTLKLCVNASVTANVGATAQATLPTLTPGSGNALYESLSGGLFVNPIFGTTPVDATHGLPTVLTSQYPSGATPITASATGTTAATTATLAGAASKTTYVCGYSIRANATANTNVTNTLTGVISGTMSSIMWVPANTAGLGVDEQIFTPCIPASTTNTAISAVSGAPGTGGLVSSKIWGYQL